MHGQSQITFISLLLALHCSLKCNDVVLIVYSKCNAFIWILCFGYYEKSWAHDIVVWFQVLIGKET